MKIVSTSELAYSQSSFDCPTEFIKLILCPPSFSPCRNKVKYLSYLRKRCNVNPARGPFHFRAPSRIFYKAIRGELKSNHRVEPIDRSIQ